MRAIFVVVHCLVGLTIAAFLFVSGLTGAVISWDHELDALINPHLVTGDVRGKRPSSPSCTCYVLHYNLHIPEMWVINRWKPACGGRRP